MSEIVVVVPTRGRPQSAARFAEAVDRSASAVVRFVVDADDPSLSEYLEAVDPSTVMVYPGPGRPGIVDPLNWAVAQLCDSWEYVGFAGDDHLPRTEGWDVQIIETLGQLGTGICYGNDLLAGERIPTAVFMTSDIPKALGYMAHPDLVHLFVDDYWAELGRELDALTYLPDVIIEHLHFLNGKSEEDDTYKRVNSSTIADHDRNAFATLKRMGIIRRDANQVRQHSRPR